MRKYILFIIVICLTNIMLVNAQTPQTFKYQALARDNNGKAIVNTNVSFRIAIVEKSITGTTVYEETHKTITNNLGLALLDIGKGTVTKGSFSAINWAAGIFFIKIEMDLKGGSEYLLMGISQLLSVPYSLYSDKAASTDYYKAGLGIDINKDIISNTAPDKVVSLKGTGATTVTGTYPDFTINSTDLNTTYNSGTGIDIDKNIITNTAPDKEVTLKGTGATTVTGTYPDFSINSTDLNTTYNAGKGLTLDGNTFNSTWTLSNNIIYNNNEGNVGVGTNNPDKSAKLQVNSTSQGFLPPVMTEQQRNAIDSPADGLIIFNSSKGCINYYKNKTWLELCGSATLPALIVTNNGPVCEGETLKLSVNSIAGASYKWTGPNNFSSILQNPEIIDTKTIMSGDYSVTASIGNNNVSASTNVTIHPLLPVSIIISTEKTIICKGENLSFSIITVNPGKAPKYQWQKNNEAIAGATNSTFSSTGIEDNDMISCILTSNAAPCATNNPAKSNELTIKVNPLIIPAITISTPSNNVCKGASVSFTASVVNGGTAPKYQWQKNSVNIQSATRSSFTTTTLANEDRITCILTSNATPCLSENPATSNAVIMTINEILPVNVSIIANDSTICEGDQVTFNAIPVNPGSKPLYQWQKNNININGATASVYIFDEAKNNDSIRCIMTSSGFCVSGNPSTSANIGITVVAPPSTANAGIDQINLEGTTATLAANKPTIGIGLWSIVAGSGGQIANPTSPTSSFSGLSGNTYILKWTIRNLCNSSSDEVIISFKSVFTCGNNIIDARDGKSYRTILFGNQCWMRDNMNIGTLVSGTTEMSNNLVIEKYCYNNIESNCTIYGGLYQWREAMRGANNFTDAEVDALTNKVQGICPVGWHLPSTTEWNTLITQLGGTTAAGATLKDVNSFNALFGGYRSLSGTFSNTSPSTGASMTFFKTSTQEDETTAFYIYLNSLNNTVTSTSDDKTFGDSVRCIKD